MSKKRLSLGLRLHNPFNIKRSPANHWKGECEDIFSIHPTFVRFDSIEHGLRAGLIILKNYVLIFHLDTIPEIISRFAPDSENDTFRYIRFVRSWLCDNNVVEPYSIKAGTKEFFAVACAMVLFESGYVISIGDMQAIYIKFHLNSNNYE